MLRIFEPAPIDLRWDTPTIWSIAFVLFVVAPAVQSALSALIGLALPLRARDDLRAAADVRRLRRLYVCVVSKGVNKEALSRTYEALAYF